MLVKDVEKRCHISKQTLFYYEKEGLIKRDRNENRYRDYSDEDVERIELIIKLRAMDISIATIKKIFNQEITVKEAVALQSQQLTDRQQDLKQAKDNIEQFLKRKKVKVVLSYRENELVINDQQLVYNDHIIAWVNIRKVHLSLCNELVNLNGSLHMAIKFRYYLDLDFEVNHQLFQFQVYCDENIYHLRQALLEHDITVDDPVGIMDLLNTYRDQMSLYRYLDRHYRQLAKQYHLDNPRRPYSMKERYTSDIQQKVIAFIDKLVK